MQEKVNLNFSREELKILKRASKDYPIFKDKKKDISFLYLPENTKNNFISLEYLISLLKHCSSKIINFNEENYPNTDIKRLNEKIESIISYILELKITNEFPSKENVFGNKRKLNKLEEKFSNNKEDIIKLLTFAENLKPSGIKPLSTSVAGLPSDEYEDIESEEEGESEEI